MFTTIRTLALSAIVGLGAMATAPVVAQADGIYLNFGHEPDDRFGIYTGDRGEMRDWHRHRHERRKWRHSCTPERALDKAERMGLRRARIVDIDRRRVKVKGRKYNERVVVTFRNRRGCPILYR